MLSSSNKECVLLFIFTAIMLASGLDLAADLSQGVEASHVFKEALVMLVAMLAIVFIMLSIAQQKVKIKILKQALNDARHIQVTPNKYVLETREKLAGVIAKQFTEWSLTDSEIEIGWLLIKGLSLKEISMIRETQEKTVRQQASTIYKKTSVSGRHAFSAWFIEDML